MHAFYIWYLSILRQNTLGADVQTVGTADTSSQHSTPSRSARRSGESPPSGWNEV